MTLPYPPETETGKLKPVDNEGPDPLDIERRVRGLVRADGEFVDIAGRRFRAQSASSAGAKAEQLGEIMTQRLLERRPNADEATWRKLEESLHEALSNHRALDEDAVKATLLMIDGL